MFENQIHLVPPSKIAVERKDRQRRDIDSDEEAHRALQRSISQRGLIHPIIVRLSEFDDYILVAGERRLLACKALGWAEIPVRFAHELNPLEAKIIELEENVARKDLSWQDTGNAIANLHALYVQLDPNWSQIKTAEAISVSDSAVSLYLRVMKYHDDPRIMECATINRADSIIKTIEGRNREAAFTALFEAQDGDEEAQMPEAIEARGPDNVADLIVTQTVTKSNIEVVVPLTDTPTRGDNKNEPSSSPRSVAQDVLNGSFLDWAPNYKGRRFNFLHVDFPYGATEVGPQMQGNEHTIYDDNPEIYINLLNCFCDNLDRFFAVSGWCMFWYSERMGQATRDLLKFKCPSLFVQPHPLIWIHSDNAGISPDHTRRPRHIYDTCMLMSRGDMPLVRLKSDAYACPTDRKLHPSTKPEPMLRYFFEMFVDHHTTMMDPTCGAGSSLRAAEALGASRVLGMDIDKDHVETARRELQARRASTNVIAGFFNR